MIVSITKTLSSALRPLLPGMKYVLVLLLGIGVFPGEAPEIAAQEEKSAVFPDDRHRELMKELDFTPPDKEEEEEEPVVEESDSDPFDWEWGDWDFGFGSGTTIAILVVLIALLGFLIFRMLGDVNMRKRTREEDEPDEINVDDIEEEKLVATGVSLSLLERAERAGQFDVAVRLMYIQLLKELQDAGFIKYRKDFSNRDYQNQLRGREVLGGFRSVTYEYERYWFGKYPIDRLSYRNTYQRFQVLNERIRSSAANSTSHV